MTSGHTTYHFLESRGVGGFGTVYRAELVTPGGFRKVVAAKVLHEASSLDPDLAARFRDEARLLAVLDHPVIVRVHSLERLAGRWVVVMEYVEGVDLDVLIQKKPLPSTVAVEIARQVASALHAAYSKEEDGRPIRLLHRDVKPSNIRISSGGTVKLLDFGIARAEARDREAKTTTQVYGSLPYMPPERLFVVDSRDLHEGDVYSLGSVMFEMLTGERFGPASTSRASHEAQLAERRVLLERSPENLRDVTLSCLAYDPKARPTARELERLLRNAERSMHGVSLIDWAERAIAGVAPPQHAPGDLSGKVFTAGTAETLAMPRPAGRGARPNRTRLFGLGAAFAASVVVAAMLVVCVVGGVFLGRASVTDVSAGAIAATEGEATAVPALGVEATTPPPPPPVPAAEPPSAAPPAARVVRPVTPSAEPPAAPEEPKEPPPAPVAPPTDEAASTPAFVWMSDESEGGGAAFVLVDDAGRVVRFGEQRPGTFEVRPVGDTQALQVLLGDGGEPATSFRVSAMTAVILKCSRTLRHCRGTVSALQ